MCWGTKTLRVASSVCIIISLVVLTSRFLLFLFVLWLSERRKLLNFQRSTNVDSSKSLVCIVVNSWFYSIFTNFLAFAPQIFYSKLLYWIGVIENYRFYVVVVVAANFTSLYLVNEINTSSNFTAERAYQTTILFLFFFCVYSLAAVAI